MRRRTILTILLAGAMSFVARAQQVIPPEIIVKGELTQADRDVVLNFVKERVSHLADADPASMKRNRDELLSPFRNPSVSVSFRQAYNTSAIAELKRLADDPKDVVAVNAMRVAGELATSDATAILEKKITDPRMAVRFAAVSGVERTMAAISARNPALPPDRVKFLIELVGKVIVDPKNADSEVVFAAERALITSLNVGLEGVRPLAFKTLSNSVSALAKRYAAVPTPVVMQVVFLRAGEATRDAIGNLQSELKGDNLKDAAVLCGNLLSWAYCQVKSGQLAVGQKETRDEPTKIVRVAETSLALACQKAKVAPPGDVKLGDDFAKAEAAGDTSFTRKMIDRVIPAVVTGFGVPNDFLGCK